MTYLVGMRSATSSNAKSIFKSVALCFHLALLPSLVVTSGLKKHPMSNMPTFIDLESQPCDSQAYGWVETQVDSPTLPRSLPDVEEEELPNTQEADLCTIPYDQSQPAWKRICTESTSVLAKATVTSNSTMLPVASTITPSATTTTTNSISPTASQHRASSQQRASDPMKFRGTMPLTCDQYAKLPLQQHVRQEETNH